MDETVKELESKGIPCEPIREGTYTGEEMTFFHDPDGLIEHVGSDKRGGRRKKSSEEIK